MSIMILLNESNASRRCIPIMCFKSNGTSACTNESGSTFMFSVGGVFYGSGGSISAVSSVDGAYMANFSASKVSVLGPGMVHYSSQTALPWATPFQIVPFDSYDSMRLGLFALPNAAAEAAGGLVTFGTGTGQMHLSSGSIGLKAQNHSGASVEVKTGGIQTTSIGVGSYSGVSVEVKTGGIQVASIGVGSYSGVSVEVKTGGIQTTSIGVGNYSGVSVEVKSGGIQTTSIGAGTYSNVTFQGVTRVNSGVTLNADTHSGATIAGIVSGGIIAATLASGTLTNAKFAASAIDAAALATDAVQEIADGLLGRNIAGGSSTGRTVSEALYPLRNRSLIQNSVGTVYLVDDVTSSWTFSPSLGTAPLSGIDPVGP